MPLEARTRAELEEALRSLPESGERVDALNALSRMEHVSEAYDRALELATEALALAVRLGDRAREGGARIRLGAAHAALGRRELAVGQFERALEVARGSGDLRMEGIVLASLGAERSRQGRNAEALEMIERSIAIHEAGGDRASCAQALMERGQVRRLLGELDLALADFLKVATMHRETGDLSAAASTLSAIGTIHRRKGRYLDALAAFREAAGYFEQKGQRQGWATVLANAGNVHLARGDGAAAIAEYERALAIRRAIGDQAGIALCLGNIGAALCQFDRPAAIAMLRKAAEAATVVKVVSTRAHALGNLSEQLLGQGQFAEARATAQESRELFEKMGDREGVARGIGILGRSFLIAGDGNPLPLLAESLALARETHSVASIEIALASYADALLRGGRFEEARAAAAELGRMTGPSPRASSREFLARMLPPAEAEPVAREALDAASLAKDASHVSSAAGALARILAANGHGAEARALMDEALAALTPHSRFGERKELLEDAVAMLRACGDEEGARRREGEIKALFHEKRGTAFP